VFDLQIIFHSVNDLKRKEKIEKIKRKEKERKEGIKKIE
jgi:hypothetical protein